MWFQAAAAFHFGEIGWFSCFLEFHFWTGAGLDTLCCSVIYWKSEEKQTGVSRGKDREKTEGSSLFSLLSMFSHLSRGEFLGASNEWQKGFQRTWRWGGKSSSDPRNKHTHEYRTSRVIFTAVPTVRIAFKPCLQPPRTEGRNFFHPPATHVGKQRVKILHQLFKIQAKYNRLLY